MPDYNAQLDANNARMLKIEETINNLPKAGSGSCGPWSRIETKTITFAEDKYTYEYPLTMQQAKIIDYIIFIRISGKTPPRNYTVLDMVFPIGYKYHFDESSIFSITGAGMYFDATGGSAKAYDDYYLVGYLEEGLCVSESGSPETMYGGDTYLIIECYK